MSDIKNKNKSNTNNSNINTSQNSNNKQTLNSIFLNYSKGEEELPVESFVKILKDAKILDEKSFTTKNFSVIIDNVKPNFLTGLKYDIFYESLEMVSKKTKINMHDIREKIDGITGKPYLEKKSIEKSNVYDDQEICVGHNILK